ncbi:hypothetical protein ACGVWS_01730 [Enterobacteriaceae bacterium LUAb1]
MHIRTMGDWNGQHGDIVPWLLVRLPRWPSHISVDIYDSARPQTPARFETFRDNRNRYNPFRNHLTLILNNDHYSLQMDNQIFTVPPDGDCFYHAVLLGLSKMNIALPGFNRAVSTENPVQLLRNLLAQCALENAGELSHFLEGSGRFMKNTHTLLAPSPPPFAEHQIIRINPSDEKYTLQKIEIGEKEYPRYKQQYEDIVNELHAVGHPLCSDTARHMIQAYNALRKTDYSNQFLSRSEAYRIVLSCAAVLRDAVILLSGYPNAEDTIENYCFSLPTNEARYHFCGTGNCGVYLESLYSTICPDDLKKRNTHSLVFYHTTLPDESMDTSSPLHIRDLNCSTTGPTPLSLQQLAKRNYFAYLQTKNKAFNMRDVHSNAFPYDILPAQVDYDVSRSNDIDKDQSKEGVISSIAKMLAGTLWLLQLPPQRRVQPKQSFA